MIRGNVPDLLTHNRLSRDGVSLRLRLETAGQEMTTGLQSDVVAATGGDLRRLYAIETSIQRLTATKDTINLAGYRAETSQAALGNLADLARVTGVDLLAAVNRNDLTAARAVAGGARADFEQAVSALNTRFAGRSLFAGAAVDTDALRDADLILTDVLAIADAAPDTATALADIDFYFNDPAGGFATNDFLGSAQDAPEADFGDGTRISYAERADSDEVRALLQSLATIVVGAEGVLGTGSTPSQVLFFQTGANGLNAARDGLTEIQSRLGVRQEQIERALTVNAAETASLDLVRTRILSKDPFEAAAEFQALEGQVASVYTVTARLASLSLTDYLR